MALPFPECSYRNNHMGSGLQSKGRVLYLLVTLKLDHSSIPLPVDLLMMNILPVARICTYRASAGNGDRFASMPATYP